MENHISIDCARKFTTNEQLPSRLYVHIYCFYIRTAAQLRLTHTVLLLFSQKYAVFIVECMSFWLCRKSIRRIHMLLPPCVSESDICLYVHVHVYSVWLLYAKLPIPHGSVAIFLQVLENEFILCIHEISKIYYHIVKLKLSPNCYCCCCCGDVFAQFPHFALSFSFSHNTLQRTVRLGWQLKTPHHGTDSVTISCSIYLYKFIRSHHFQSIKDKRKINANFLLHFISFRLQ